MPSPLPAAEQGPADPHCRSRSRRTTSLPGALTTIPWPLGATTVARVPEPSTVAPCVTTTGPKSPGSSAETTPSGAVASSAAWKVLQGSNDGAVIWHVFRSSPTPETHDCVFAASAGVGSTAAASRAMSGRRGDVTGVGGQSGILAAGCEGSDGRQHGQEQLRGAG